MVPPMSCLNLDYPVVAMRSDPPFGTPWVLCEFITSAMVPVEDTNGLFWNDYYSNIPLQWDNPDCGACEERGGRCGLVGEDVLRLACYGLPAQGEIIYLDSFSFILLSLGLFFFFTVKINPNWYQQKNYNKIFS